MGYDLISFGAHEDEEPEVPSDWDGDPDEYFAQLYDRPPPANEIFPFLEEEDNKFKVDKEHPFSVTTQAWLHYCFGFLEQKDLFTLCVLNKQWSKELDNQFFWAKRYVRDLGEERYKASLFLHSSNGWTAKQHLTWSLVAAAANNCFSSDQESAKFELQRNVWCGIMKERKRKYYELENEQEEEEARKKKEEEKETASNVNEKLKEPPMSS